MGPQHGEKPENTRITVLWCVAGHAPLPLPRPDASRQRRCCPASRAGAWSGPAFARDISLYRKLPSAPLFVRGFGKLARNHADREDLKSPESQNTKKCLNPTKHERTDKRYYISKGFWKSAFFCCFLCKTPKKCLNSRKH